MKDGVILLLCAVALAHGLELNIDQRTRTCNCDPSEAQQICEANYGIENVLIAHEYCNKFYKCTNGKPVAYECPANTLYDPVVEACLWPSDVDCGERPISDGSETDESDCDDESGADDNVSDGGDDNDNVGTCNCNPGEAPSICANEGSNGILVAHQNCNQFYMCADGIPVTFNCPPGLLYDPYTTQCTWPQNVECGDRVIADLDNDNDDNSNNEDDGTCYDNPKDAPTICADPGSNGALIAHENCDQFYICAHGAPTAVSCSGTLLFDPCTKQCQWPREVDCGDRIVPDPETCSSCNQNNESDEVEDLPGDDLEDSPEKDIDDLPPPGDDTDVPTSTEDSGNDDQQDIDDLLPPGDDTDVPSSTEDSGNDDQQDNTCNCNPEEAPSICANEDSDGILIAHENCNQFYKCDHGKPVALSCPGVLLYNPYTEKCDYPENVDCGDRVIPDPEDDSENESGGVDVLPPPEEDSSDGNGNEGTCNCNPEEAPAICANEDSDGILIAHENCNQFYKCDHGKPVALSCPGVLLYNPYTEKCDYPENVECGDRVTPDLEDDSESESADIDDLPPPGDDTGIDTDSSPETDNDVDDSDCDEDGNNENVTCNCNPEEAPSICANEDSSGNLIAHENCNQFYICDHGKPVALSCPGALLYNPHTEKCDYPENVECGDRVIPDPEDDSGNESGDTDVLPPPEEDSGDGNGNEGTCNCNPEEAPAICAEDGSSGTLIAHESCNKFYKCDHGVPVEFTCPGNLLYNPYKEVCDWPSNVDCGDRDIPEPDSENESGDVEVLPPPEEDSDDGNDGNGNEGTCNCNPEEAPAICAEDGSSGTLIAHESCNKFYKCDHGVPVEFTCPGNLLYNPYKEVCDWPSNVDCGDRDIPEPDSENESGDVEVLPPPEEDSDDGNDGNGNEGTCNCNPEEAPAICAEDGSSGTLIAHESCNKFYKCDHGVPVEFTCPGNLLYNPYKEVCDWPSNVDCGDRDIPEPDSENESGDVEVLPPPEEDSDDGNDGNGNEGTCNCNPEEAPAICAEDGSSGTLIAHESCNKFYKCDHGVPVEFTCPGNLLYNPYKEVCDWPSNVDCGDRDIPEPDSENESGDVEVLPPPEEDSDDGNDGNGNEGTCNCNPEEAPAICAEDGSSGTLIAHENCNQFYKCDHGIPVAFNCPGELLYNPYTEKCDYSENVDCGDRVIPDHEDDSESESADIDDLPPPGDDSGNDNDNTCNCNPEEAPSICAQEGSDGVLIAHENCDQFYKCDQGKPVEFNCPGVLLFNPYTKKCDYPENVECGDRVTPDHEDDSESESADIDDLPPPGDDTGTDTDNNSEDNTDSDDSDCDGDNNEQDTCNCNPEEAPSICAVANSDGVLIAHEYCNKFYQCNNGKPVAFWCPGNLLFNPNTQQCDWPVNVDCGDRDIAEPEEEEVSDTNEVEDDNNVGTCNCNPEEAPAICALDGSNNVQIAHENCNQFYKCDHGTPVAFTCSENLLYNPYTERCDWADNVECGDRVIPDPNEDNDAIEDEESDNGNQDIHEDPSQAPEICASPDSEGVLVAHENCDQYYICSGGLPVPRPCSGDLLFNPLNQQCDWATNVECGDRIVPGGNDCACNPRNAPALCSRPDSYGKLIAHENCNQFYMCVDAVPVAHFCPGVLHYNIDKEVCDWPQNVDCSSRMVTYASLNKHMESRQTLKQ